MSEAKFVDGLWVRKPSDKAPDYVKCGLSFEREKLIAWLYSQADDSINVDIQESKGGKWYAKLSNFVPRSHCERQDNNQQTGGYVKNEPARKEPPLDDDLNDDIPF